MNEYELKKIMNGSPPPKEYQVTLENWRKHPYNSWAFVNVRNLIPTSAIDIDPSKKINLNKNLINLNDILIKHEIGRAHV